MKNKALMKLIVDRPWLVRQVLLTDREAVFVRYLKTENGITSRVFASRWNISIQNASTVLCKLHKKGYLSRTKQGHDSGGDEYLYKPAI